MKTIKAPEEFLELKAKARENGDKAAEMLSVSHDWLEKAKSEEVDAQVKSMNLSSEDGIRLGNYFQMGYHYMQIAWLNFKNSHEEFLLVKNLKHDPDKGTIEETQSMKEQIEGVVGKAMESLKKINPTIKVKVSEEEK